MSVCCRIEGRELAGEPPRVPESVLDLFAGNPFWTVTAHAERLEVAYTTAQRAIERLETLGAISLDSGERGKRVYWAGAILDVLEDIP